MRRLRRSLLVLSFLLPLLLVAGPRAVAGDQDRAEQDLLRMTYRTLGDLAMQYAELADFYRATGKPDRAEMAREAMAHLVAQQAKIAKRISDLVGGVKLPIVPKVPRKEPLGPRIAIGSGAGGVFSKGPLAISSGIFSGRGGRRNLRSEGGGGTGGAVDLGLEWLENHQDPEGFWDCDGFTAHCKLDNCGGPGYSHYDPGVSGLALLAFLGTGETHKRGRYRGTVKVGLKYLKQIQDPEGCFGPRTTSRFVYNHGCASIAMIEAYALTGSPLFKQSAQLALDFIVKSQNPYLGWRYGIRPQDNDTSVTGWMVMALVSGKHAGGLRVPTSGFDGARTWIEKVTEPEYGKVGYTARGTGPARRQDVMDRFPPDRSEALTGAGIAMRILMGEDPKKSEMIQKGTELCMKVLPEWSAEKGTVDMYYWFYGSIAMHQIGGEPWKVWNKSMKAAVLDHQEKQGDAKGSWKPLGPWGREGGRVYSTALMTLCLESYYRYSRLFPITPRRIPRIVAPVVRPAPDLSHRITLSLAEAPLANALNLLAKISGSTILFEPSARETVLETTMTLSVKDLDLKSVLDLVAAYGDLSWSVKGNAIVFEK